MNTRAVLIGIFVTVLLFVSIRTIMFIRTRSDKSLSQQLSDLQAINNALQRDILRLTKTRDERIFSSINIPPNTTGELTLNELDPSVPYKLDIIMPTIPRDRNGYTYLEQSVSSHFRVFGAMNVDVNVYAYSRSVDKPLIFDKRFHFKTIKPITLAGDRLPSKRPGYVRYDSVLGQNLDWVTMMSEYKKVCKQNQIFLYMEDDFTSCPLADTHIMSVFHWALKHRSEWKSIRLTFGFSGLLMQCDDIDEYLKYVWEHFLSPHESIYPIDYGLAEYWTQYDDREGKRVHHTFRYNLFQHNGAISTVQNDADMQFNPKCWDGMAHSFNYHFEKFDTFSCQHYLISPCQKPEIQRELDFQGADTLTARPILNGVDKKLFEMKIGVQLVEAEVTDESCDQVCSANGLNCFREAYPLANSCEELKSRGKCRWNKCMNEVWQVWKYNTPFVYDNACVIADEPAWQCDYKWKFDKAMKLCPCSKVSR
jgi:hypothetical protein